MKLLDAYDDFATHSLAHLQSLWEKLSYISGLRTAEGYRHWGMDRAFGAAGAEGAIARAHHEVWAELLTGSLQHLAAEPPDQAEERPAEAMAPANCGRSGILHFELVQQTLKILRHAA